MFFRDVLSMPSPIRLPTGLPVGDVNVYLIETPDGTTLVDTGPRTEATLAALEEGLAARGLALRDVNELWLTHSHVDHIGLAGEVVARSGARVFGSEEVRAWLADWEGMWRARTAATGAFCHLAGAPPGTDGDIASTFDRLASIGSGLEGVKAIDEGDTVGGWDVVRVDGHARGHLAFVGERAVITGDFLLERISSNAIVEPPEGPGEAWPSMLTIQIASLSRALGWQGRTGFGGHGPTMSDIPHAAGRHIAAAERRQMAFLKDLARPMTLWQATRSRFPDALGERAFLAMSETAGHLFRLRDRHLVRMDETSGTWTFQAVARVT